MYMNRIKYLDAIKFIAILSIICIHVAIIWPYSEIKGYNISGFSEFCRFGVPLFLMVSGALLLGREYDLRSFFREKINKNYNSIYILGNNICSFHFNIILFIKE